MNYRQVERNSLSCFHSNNLEQLCWAPGMYCIRKHMLVAIYRDSWAEFLSYTRIYQHIFCQHTRRFFVSTHGGKRSAHSATTYKMRTGHSRGGGDIVADSTPTGGEAATAAPGAAATNQNPDKQWTTAKVVVLSSVPTSHDYGYLHWFRFNFHRFQPSIVFSLFTQERRNCNLCVTAFCPVKKIMELYETKCEILAVGGVVTAEYCTVFSICKKD